NLLRQAFELSHAVESEPGLALAAFVDLPVRAGAPLLRPEPLAVEPGLLRRGIVALGPHQVHGCPREVVEPSRVIEVEVRENDVAHVARRKTERLDLADRGHLLAEIRLEQGDEEATQPRPRRGNVAQAEAGV